MDLLGYIVGALSLCTIEHLDGIEGGIAWRERWRFVLSVVTCPIVWCRNSHISVVMEYRAFEVPIQAGLSQTIRVTFNRENLCSFHLVFSAKISMEWLPGLSGSGGRGAR